MSLITPSSPRYRTLQSPSEIPDEFLSPGERLKKAILKEVNILYDLIMKGFFIKDDFYRLQKFCYLYEDGIEKARKVILKFIREALLEILHYYNQETTYSYEEYLQAWFVEFDQMITRENWTVYKIIQDLELHMSRGLLKIFEEHHRIRFNLSTQDYRNDYFHKKICNLSVIFKYVQEKYLLKENVRLWSEMYVHLDHVMIQYTPLLNMP